ncbi:MAG: Rrf2 family transcriptional regulator [bacterium]|nr:Rrf2 family transcriptional regulator [bacterium]
MSLTKAGDYAIRAMIFIGCLPEDAVALRSDVARTQGIPSSFTAKILRRLVRARLLKSSRGVNGGFALARSAAEISMLDIVTAIEGPLSLTSCSCDPEGCEWARDCPASLVWPQVQKSIENALRGISLESLVSAPRANGRIAPAPSDLDALTPNGMSLPRCPN